MCVVTPSAPLSVKHESATAQSSMAMRCTTLSPCTTLTPSQSPPQNTEHGRSSLSEALVAAPAEGEASSTGEAAMQRTVVSNRTPSCHVYPVALDAGAMRYRSRPSTHATARRDLWPSIMNKPPAIATGGDGMDTRRTVFNWARNTTWLASDDLPAQTSIHIVCQHSTLRAQTNVPHSHV